MRAEGLLFPIQETLLLFFFLMPFKLKFFLKKKRSNFTVAYCFLTMLFLSNKFIIHARKKYKFGGSSHLRVSDVGLVSYDVDFIYQVNV